MTIKEFTSSVSAQQPPAGIGSILQALWHDANGHWEMAHNVAQGREGTAEFDRLHAYLHRKEGDDGNAGYWYRRAPVAVYAGSLPDEWLALVKDAVEAPK